MFLKTSCWLALHPANPFSPVNSQLKILSFSVQAPLPCEEKVVLLEAQIKVLNNVISDQHRYIDELHKSQAQQLEHLPNSHLGTRNLYRGRARFSCLQHILYVPHWQSVFLLRGRWRVNIEFKFLSVNVALCLLHVWIITISENNIVRQLYQSSSTFKCQKKPSIQKYTFSASYPSRLFWCKLLLFMLASWPGRSWKRDFNLSESFFTCLNIGYWSIVNDFRFQWLCFAAVLVWLLLMSYVPLFGTL